MNQFVRVSFVCTVSLVCILLIGGRAIVAQLMGESPDSESEEDVLVTLYHATKGDFWTNKEGWLSDAPLREWYGVTVRDDRVVELDLSCNNLSGALPDELAHLARLQKLDLRWNALTGHLPHLGDLHELTLLLLTDNQFSGSIPAWVVDLETLVRLDLSHNQFKGEIPAEIGMLRSLRSLALHHNDLSGPIPDQLENAAALRRLILNDNALTGAIPEELGSLSFLRHLNLSNNHLSGKVPTWILSSKTMEWVDLSANAFDQDNKIVLYRKLPDYDEFWGDQEDGGMEVAQNKPRRPLDPIVMNMWAQTSEIYEEPQTRAFILESLGSLEVRDGILRVSEDHMTELVRRSNVQGRAATVNAHLKKSNTLITSANDLERAFKVVEPEMPGPQTSTETTPAERKYPIEPDSTFEHENDLGHLVASGSGTVVGEDIRPAVFIAQNQLKFRLVNLDDSDVSLEEELSQGDGAPIGKVRLSSWYPTRDSDHLINTKSKYSLIAEYQDVDVIVNLDFRLFKWMSGLMVYPKQKAIQTPPSIPWDQDFTVHISHECENGVYYTVFRSKFRSSSGKVSPPKLMLKTMGVYVGGCW